MAVTFTTNIGLAKPTEAELADNWINGTELYDDNNAIIIDEMDIPLTLYTPTLVADTTNPNVGAGTRKGEYQDIKSLIMGRFRIEFLTPGITAGSGVYAVSLPFTVDSSHHSVGGSINAAPGTFSVVGEGYYYDASNTDVSGAFALDVVTVTGVSYVRMLMESYTTPAKTSNFVTNAVPPVPATGDVLLGNFFYRRT